MREGNIYTFPSAANDNTVEEHPVPKRNGEVLIDGMKLQTLRIQVQEVADTLPDFLGGLYAAHAEVLVAPLTRTEVIQRINGIDTDSVSPQKAAYYQALINRLQEEGEE